MALKPKKEAKKISMPAGVPNRTRITGNEYFMPQWKRTGDTDQIDASAKSFELDKPGVPATSSAVDFKNMETRLNSWTLDTIYNPMTGGAKNLPPAPDASEPAIRSLIKTNAIHRSYNVLPSAINHTNQEYDIVSGKQVNDLRRVVTKSVGKQETKYGKRATVSKYNEIVYKHNMC